MNKILKHLKNQFIVVMFKNLLVTSIDPETGMSISDHISFEGYLIDCDKEHIYLSEVDEGEVDRIIPRENIGFIGLAKHQEVKDDIIMPEDYNGELN